MIIIEFNFLQELLFRQSKDAQRITELEKNLHLAGKSNQEFQIANNQWTERCEELQKAWFNAFSTLERFRATIYQLEQELQNRNNTQSQRGGIPSLLNPEPMTADVGHAIASSQE